MEDNIYNEFDVAEHTIMLADLPTNVPCKDLEKGLKQMLELIIENEGLSDNGDQASNNIVKVVVASNFKKCIDLYKDLKYNHGCYQKLMLMNKQKDLDPNDREVVKV